MCLTIDCIFFFFFFFQAEDGIRVLTVTGVQTCALPILSYGDFASRGVSTWLDESAPAGAVCRRRIFVATAQSQLIALDARDGRPCAGFGRAGGGGLKTGLRIPPFEPGAYSVTAPPGGVDGLV